MPEYDPYEDFNQPGINLLDPYLISELTKVDPRSEFAWTFYENRSQVEKYVSRREYIRLQILKKVNGR